MKNWTSPKGDYLTPGGDPLYMCPVCGEESKESWHVYGIESPETRMDKCPHCGEPLKYPGEWITGNEMEPDKVYRVTKDNTDGSVFKGDLLYIDKNDGRLVCNTCGWLDKEDLAPAIMDFKCVLAKDYEVYRERWSIGIRKVVR